MTFRRIMLVVLPLLGAVCVFMILRWVFSGWEATLEVNPPLQGEAMPPLESGDKGIKVQKTAHFQRSINVELLRKDREGRTEMRFLADVIDAKTENTADIERPRIQFFTKSGEIITLLADHGRAVTKGSLTRIDDIESGVLWGHVVITHDRGTPDDHSDDLVATVDDLKFGGEAYELTTDGPVIVTSLDMDLTARRMRMALDRKTRRINTITFLEDIRITMETKGRRMMGSPAGGSTAAAASPGSAPPAGAGSPASPRSAAPAPAAGSAAVTAAGAAVEERGDLWRIDLAGHVDARQGDQRLTCDRLSLYSGSVQAAGEESPAASGGPTPAGAPARGASVAAAGTEATPPAKAPAGRSRRGDQPEGTAAAGSRRLQPGAAPPMVVMAEGPLIITPVAPPERKILGLQRYQLVAIGSPTVVEDGPTRIVGSEVQFNTQTEVGSVIGKDAPILLEQPGRLHLTGKRLDFDRTKAIVDVQGAGQLAAQVESANFSGAGRTKRAAAEPGPAELPSALDAVWTRGMRLEFYRLPADLGSGTGEVRHAEFHGQAVVKQTGGIMRGEDLAIDFFRPEAGRGQSVERLVGHGNVFIKNESAEKPGAVAAAPAPVAKKDSAKPAVGDITCQDVDMRFARDAAGDVQPKSLKASGGVIINDPSGKIRAEDLTVAFGPSSKGGTDTQFVEAFGNVLLDRDDLHAEGDHVRRDLAAGTLLMEGNPARAARGKSRIVGPHIEFAQAEGKATVRGAGELEIPATTDLRGRQRQSAQPLIVQWQKSMQFEDKRNFAQFDGGAVAITGGSRVMSDRLWVYFIDQPDKPAAAAAGAAPAAAKDKTTTGGDDMAQLFGHKALQRVLAEKNVHAIEQQEEPDHTLRYQMEIFGDNLTYVDQDRKAYLWGPGRLQILSHEKPKVGATPPGIAPSAAESAWKDGAPDGYARTRITWIESMAYDGAGDRAYFKGKVQMEHAGRGAPGEGATDRRRAPTVTRIQSADLQAAFSEKNPPAAAPGQPGQPVRVVAKPPATANPAAPPEERMTVQKVVADGGVKLSIDDRRGTGERLIYQRDPELIRLYRGADDWARLWQQNEASQEYGEIVARVITYQPATVRVDVVDQQSIILSPKPKPLVPAGKSAVQP